MRERLAPSWLDSHLVHDPWYTTEDFILSGGNFDEFVTMDVASFSDSLKRGLALWNASETPVQT